MGSPGLSSPGPRQDGAPLTVSLLLFRLGGCHPRRRPGLCGGEEPGGVPRLRHPLLPHLPGERRASASRSHGLGAWGGRLPAQGLLCAGVTSHCTPLDCRVTLGLCTCLLTPSEACRHGSGRRCPESACPSEAGPAGALPGGGGLVPASCASSRGRPADKPVPISPARGRLEPEQCTQLCVCVCVPVCACTRVPVCVCVHERVHVPVCVVPRLTGAHLRREAVPLEVASGKLRGPLPLSPEPVPCVHSASCFSPSC